MSKVLNAAGSGLEHIVKANIYLLYRDRDFAAMNEVYQEVIGIDQSSIAMNQRRILTIPFLQFFHKDAMPARTCVGVASLPLGALVEIDCVAEIPS